MELKEIIQLEHNIVKNSNWPEANQIASLTGRPLDHVASNNASNNDIHEIKYIKSRLQTQQMLGHFS